LPVGGGSAREGSPLAGWWDRLRPQRAMTPGAAPTAVFVAYGDQREEVQQLVTATAASDAVRELRYIPGEEGEAGVTRLVIDERAGALLEALSLQPDWSREGAR
jgi:hypothetical protein